LPLRHQQQFLKVSTNIVMIHSQSSSALTVEKLLPGAAAAASATGARCSWQSFTER